MVNETSSPTASTVDVLIDVLVSPRTLFGLPFAKGRWISFALMTGLLIVFGYVTMLPAIEHEIRADPTYYARAAQGNADVSVIVARRMFAAHTLWATNLMLAAIGITLLFVLLAVVLIAFGRRVPRGESWLLANEIGLVKLGVSSAVLGVIVTIRGPESFSSPTQIFAAMPSAAWIFPNASDYWAHLLNVIDPFNIWTAGLIAAALTVVGRLRIVTATIVGILIAFGPQALIRASGFG